MSELTGARFHGYAVGELLHELGPVQVYEATYGGQALQLEVYDVLAPQDVSNVMQAARIVTKLPIECVVPVLDLGALEDGRAYLARPLLAGALLEEHVPCAPPRARELVRDLATCLRVAHEAGIAVGELRSDRVFVEATPAGERIRLWDLRFARPTQPMSEHTLADLSRCVAILFELITGARTTTPDPDDAPAFANLFRRAFESTPDSPAFAYADELIDALATEDGSPPAPLPVARLLPKKK